MAQIKVVTLHEKDPYIRGLHHGEECRAGIALILEAWKRHLRSRLTVPVGIINNTLTTKLSALPFKRFIPQHLMTEMKGIATGANRKLAEILFLNCFDDLFRILFQRGSPEMTPQAQALWREWNQRLMACSSFAVKTTQGKLLAGINLDQGVIEDELCRLVTAFRYGSHDGQPAFMSVLVPGYVGVLRGMNDRGVFLGHHTVHVVGARKFGIPHGILLREALAGKDILDVRLKIVTQRRTIGSNIILGDEQRTYVLECSTEKDQWSMRSLADSPHKERGYIVATNHFETECMQKHYKPEYIAPGVGVAEFHLDSKYTVARYRKLEKFLKKTRVETPEDVCRGLEKVSNSMTVQSIVFDPADKAMYVAVPEDGYPPAPRDCSLVKVSV